MGSGSRSAHQTHHVDTGLASSATATTTLPQADPRTPARVEHLVPTPTAVIGLSYAYPEPDQPGYLDVGWHGSDATHRFDGVPPDVWARLCHAREHGESIGPLIFGEVHGRYPYTNVSPDDALAARFPAQPASTAVPGSPLRCRSCGQFVSASGGHDCPVRHAGRRHYVSGLSHFVMPDVAVLQQHCDFDSGGLHIPVAGFAVPVHDGRRGGLSGEVIVPAPREQFDPVAASQALVCDCGETGCQHAQNLAALVVDRIRTPPVQAPDRRAATAVLTQLAQEHDTSVAQQAAAQADQRDNTSLSYSDNPAAFDAAYAAARTRMANGEPAIPYQMENATGGLGARDGGRAFGVELEFDLPEGPHRSDALQAIATELHQAGLSTTPEMSGYHASLYDGYSDNRNAWRLEEDCTVAGEIVSPILYDTPETWRDLQTVCDIIRRHGGTATTRTGGHVHVSAGDYDHTVANHNRLLRMVDSHTDTMFRLATNPERGSHRGTEWCDPNYVPTQGYRNVSDARDDNWGHELAINLQSMRGERSDHVEFRMWDGSLDPAVIQTQINLSLGLTEAAFRDADLTSLPNGGRRDRLGDHYQRYGRDNAHANEWRESTRSVRSLLDAIFHRDQDKAQAASLFAATQWQR